jgi:hypothetical protein
MTDNRTFSDAYKKRSGGVISLAALALTLGIIAPSASAQEAKRKFAVRCALTVADAPELRGLKLGMTFDKVWRMYPSASWPPAVLGVRSARLLPDEAQTVGVSWIDTTFIDDRLVSITVQYDVLTFKSAGEFAERVTDGLDLPGAQRDAGDVYKLACAGFALAIDYDNGSMPSVRLFERSADEEIIKRRARARERAQDAFKP